MDNILVVEDSTYSSRLISSALKGRLGVNTVCSFSLKETEEYLNTIDDFFAAVLDFNLPDAPDGEAIDLVASKGIPSIVFSGFSGDDIYDSLWTKKIVDYVIKEDSQSIDYICEIVNRLMKNRHLKALVVDDSRMIRKVLRDFLELHQFNVFEAENGVEGFSILENNPDIFLLITDFNMPEMDGFELVKKVRKIYAKDRLAIIGLSSAGDNTASKFIKFGANDFIHKPFKNEELASRINNTLDMIDNINVIREAAYTDFLTGLNNRKYFFEHSQSLMNECKNKSTRPALGLIDIDFFKKVNDKYGHEAGDKVLVHVAHLIKEHFDGCGIVARIGGEEFVTLIENSPDISLGVAYRNLRQTIESSPLVLDGKKIKVTISIGVFSSDAHGIEDMLKQADDKLYEAKNSGRNRVEITEI